MKPIKGRHLTVVRERHLTVVPDPGTPSLGDALARLAETPFDELDRTLAPLRGCEGVSDRKSGPAARDRHGA